jgi:hypothetical protein
MFGRAETLMGVAWVWIASQLEYYMHFTCVLHAIYDIEDSL